MTTMFHHISGGIDEKKARKTLDHLTWMDAEAPTADWEITLSSPGGSMDSGSAIYNALYHYSTRGRGAHHITTKVRGEAASVASLIFQAGDYRVGGKMDMIHMHEPTLSIYEAPLRNVKEHVAQCEKWVTLYVDAVLARSNMPRGEFMKRLVGHEWMMFMEEAISHGFADAIA